MKQDITCPQCKNEFVVNLSGQSGTYNPTCPKCNYKFRIKLKQPLLSMQQHKSELKYDTYLHRRQGSKVPIIIGVIVVVAIVVIASMLFLILSYKDKEGENGNKIVIMTYQEYMDDKIRYGDSVNHTFVETLKSVDQGDVLKIKDTIFLINYNESEHTTSIDFKFDITASGYSYSGFSFEGNLTGKYHLDDTVSITLHVIYVCYEKVLGNTTWTIKGETFEEMFDKETQATKPIPMSCIELVGKRGTS